MAMRFESQEQFEDIPSGQCLCQFWWIRNYRWAWYGVRLDALTLGWWCPVHGTVVADARGGFSCPWPRAERRHVPKRRDGQLVQTGLWLGDAA